MVIEGEVHIGRGIMVAGKLTWWLQEEAKNSRLQIEARSREKAVLRWYILLLSKHAPRERLPLARPYFLELPKQCH